MAEQDVPDGEGVEPIPMASVWRPAAAPPPPPVPVSQPSYTQGDYRSYGQYVVARPSRPGPVTALGVCSIVVAGLTFVACVICLMEAGTEYASVGIARIVARQAQVAAVPVTTGNAAGPDGLASAERDVAVSVFATRQTLTDARQAQLDALLGTGGQSILGLPAGEVTSQGVRSVVRSAAVGRSSRAGQAGPDVFTLRTGKVELYDTHAVFHPDDRATADVRVSADAGAYAASHGDPGTQGPVSPLPTTAAPSSPPVSVSRSRGASGALSTVLVETGLSAVLAIYLLVIGIVTVRGGRSGALTHWIFVAAKALLIGTSLYAWVKFETELTAVRALIPAGVARSPQLFGGGGGGVPLLPTTMSVLAGGYVALIVVLLLMPAAREYYKQA